MYTDNWLKHINTIGNISLSAIYGGDEAIATYACISYIICIIYLIPQGVGDGSQPLMSMYYGEKNTGSLKNIRRLAYCFYAAEQSLLSYILTFIEPILMPVLMLILPPLFGAVQHNTTFYRCNFRTGHILAFPGVPLYHALSACFAH